MPALRAADTPRFCSKAITRMRLSARSTSRRMERELSGLASHTKISSISSSVCARRLSMHVFRNGSQLYTGMMTDTLGCMAQPSIASAVRRERSARHSGACTSR